MTIPSSYTRVTCATNPTDNRPHCYVTWPRAIPTVRHHVVKIVTQKGTGFSPIWTIISRMRRLSNLCYTGVMCAKLATPARKLFQHTWTGSMSRNCSTGRTAALRSRQKEIWRTIKPRIPQQQFNTDIGLWRDSMLSLRLSCWSYDLRFNNNRSVLYSAMLQRNEVIALYTFNTASVNNITEKKKKLTTRTDTRARAHTHTHTRIHTHQYFMLYSTFLRLWTIHERTSCDGSFVLSVVQIMCVCAWQVLTFLIMGDVYFVEKSLF